MQCVNQCFVPEYFSKPAICVLSSKINIAWIQVISVSRCCLLSDIYQLHLIILLSELEKKVLKDFGTISICLQAPSAVIFDYIWIVIIAYQKKKKILFLTKTCKQDWKLIYTCSISNPFFFLLKKQFICLLILCLFSYL